MSTKLNRFKGGVDAVFIISLCVAQSPNNKLCHFRSDRCGQKHIYVKVTSLRTYLLLVC